MTGSVVSAVAAGVLNRLDHVLAAREAQPWFGLEHDGGWRPGDPLHTRGAGGHVRPMFQRQTGSRSAAAPPPSSASRRSPNRRGWIT